MSARREDLGHLSREESTQKPATTFPRRNYTEALAVAERARDELVERLQAGVPAVHAIRDSSVYVAQATLYRLVDSYRWASIALYQAAQLVCDAECIEDRDAAEHGIRFEVPL